MARKMASIQRIKAIRPIPGADQIEVATVQGWEVVVKKGDYTEGQLAVYLEIDSFVPTTIAPFLTKDGHAPKEYNDVQGERLKTIKLRKQLSQGLLLPVKQFPQLFTYYKGEGFDPEASAEGMDVTEALGVQKWEAPEEKATNNGQMPSKTRSFPYFIKKTDQERCQNYGHMIAQNLDTRFEVTVKKDGSSLTVFRVLPDSPYYADAKQLVSGKQSPWQRIKAFVLRKKDEPVFGLCSRNVLLPLDGTSNFHVAAQPLINKLKNATSILLDGSVALQGELVAPDIQGNYERVSGIEFHLFDIFEIDNQEYMLPGGREHFAAVYGINHATIVDRGSLRNILQLKEGEDPVQKLLTYASGEGDNPGVRREGVVFKAEDKDFSFKVISNEYLLKKG